MRVQKKLVTKIKGKLIMMMLEIFYIAPNVMNKTL
jgi:hypothetical protein